MFRSDYDDFDSIESFDFESKGLKNIRKYVFQNFKNLVIRPEILQWIFILDYVIRMSLHTNWIVSETTNMIQYEKQCMEIWFVNLELDREGSSLFLNNSIVRNRITIWLYFGRLRQ